MTAQAICPRKLRNPTVKSEKPGQSSLKNPAADFSKLNKILATPTILAVLEMRRMSAETSLDLNALSGPVEKAIGLGKKLQQVQNMSATH